MEHGLVLDLPGAPLTPHAVSGVRGLYVPGVPTPVGGPGEMGTDLARSLSADPTVPLTLVPVADAAPLRAAHEGNLTNSRRALAEARKVADGAEHEQIRNEIDATRKVTG